MIDTSFEEILKRFRINKFIETGTDMGETVATVSKWFAKLEPSFGRVQSTFTTGAQSYNKWNTPIEYPIFSNVKDSEYKIYSVDLDEESYRKAVENFATNRNIQLIHSSSEQFLQKIIAEYRRDPNNRLFFFLDAHWGKYWPIRDELKAIATLDKFAIAIDDFFVPGRSNVGKARGDFGFDFYRDRILCWGYIHDCFAPASVRVFYPPQPNRDRRGWVLMTRGYTSTELEFTKGMGLFEVSAEDSKHQELLKPVFSTYLDLRIILRMLLPLGFLRKGFQVTRALGLKVG
jgi:hypothetical protein